MNDKASSTLWLQGEPIATIPPSLFSETQESMHLIEVVDEDLPLSICRHKDKDYPIVGDRWADPKKDSSMHRPMDTIVLARLDANKQPVCIGYHHGQPSLYTASTSDVDMHRLPYAHVQQETGLHFLEDKPLFVVADRIAEKERAFLLHGDRVIDSARKIQALSIGWRGPCYAKQDQHTHAWTIVSGTETYSLDIHQITSVENLIVQFFDEQGAQWECLAHRKTEASYLGHNVNSSLGGVGFRLSNLSLTANCHPLVIEENRRDLSAEKPEATYTVIQTGLSTKRFPLPWLTQSQRVKRLMLVKDKPALVVVSVAPTKEKRFVSSVFYNGDRSPFYDQILPDSLQADDKTLSFIARKGFDVFRVTRAI